MRATYRIKNKTRTRDFAMPFLILQVPRMRKFSYSGALVVCSPHTRIFCRSNLSRISSTRDKFARVRRALVLIDCRLFLSRPRLSTFDTNVFYDHDFFVCVLM